MLRIALLANSSRWLEPFYRAFSPDHEVWWGTFEEPIYRSLAKDFPRVVYEPNPIEKLSTYSGNIFRYQRQGIVEGMLNDKINPDIWITDVTNRLAQTKKTCMWVSASHSFCYKRYTFHESVLPYDLILLPGNYHRREFIKRLGYSEDDPRLAVTGFAKLDPAFQLTSVDKRNFLLSLGLRGDKFTFLYAPTWGGVVPRGAWRNAFWPRWLNEDPGDLLQRLADLLRDCDCQLIVKPHHLCAEDARMLVSGLHDAEHVYLVRDAPDFVDDISPFLFASNALISDVSGLITEFIAFEKPVISIRPSSTLAWDDPSIPEDLLPSPPETSFEQFLQSVRALAEARMPRQSNAKLRLLRKTLFEYADGESAFRAKSAILRRYRELAAVGSS